jgi:hypothetical protein
MLARDLRPGDTFRVDPPDPESPVRLCLANERGGLIRWGFPNNPTFWCSMGELCVVDLVERVRFVEVET